MLNSKSRIILLLISSFFMIGLTLSAKIRIGVEGSYVEVNNSNEHYLSYIRYMTVHKAYRATAEWIAGDDITGKTPEEIQTIVDNIKAFEPSEKIMREIFDKMQEITLEWFSFADVGEAYNTVWMRKEAVYMMNQMNAHKHYYYINNGLSYFTNTTHWKPAFNKSYWRVQKSGNAYDAIQELCNTSFHTDGECAGAVIACIWWASSQVLGKDAFNLAYPGEKALNMRKFADEKDDSFRRKHIKSSIDFTVHVPGDWLYMKNHNYGKVVNKKTNNKEFWKKKDPVTGLPWLSENQSYPWSGENAFYSGQDANGIAIYEGLGLRKSEEDMREELRLAYNRQLEKVIDNDGKVDGVPVENLPKGPETDLKITWTSVVRIYPLLNN